MGKAKRCSLIGCQRLFLFLLLLLFFLLLFDSLFLSRIVSLWLHNSSGYTAGYDMTGGCGLLSMC